MSLCVKIIAHITATKSIRGIDLRKVVIITAMFFAIGQFGKMDLNSAGSLSQLEIKIQ
jgi:hypothetical protein